eukprot:m.233543 g.233543  ORF g.233543 m.233543 type:complete len:69 (-) comp19295_c0_seq13:473-679(-)
MWPSSRGPGCRKKFRNMNEFSVFRAYRDTEWLGSVIHPDQMTALSIVVSKWVFFYHFAFTTTTFYPLQ